MSSVQSKLEAIKNIITIELPIYDIDIIVMIVDDFNIPDKKFGLDLSEYTFHGEPVEDVNVPCAWTVSKENEKTKRCEIYVLFNPKHIDYNTICHELFHVVGYICKERDIKFDIDNDEPMTYLQGYVGEKILQFREKYLKHVV